MNKRATRQINTSEDQICIAFWQEICLRKLDSYVIKLEHKAKRNVWEGVKLKKMGLRKGVADYFVLSPNLATKGLWLEFKTKIGKQSPEQMSFAEQVRNLDYVYKIARSSAEGVKYVKQWVKYGK